MSWWKGPHRMEKEPLWSILHGPGFPVQWILWVRDFSVWPRFHLDVYLQGSFDPPCIETSCKVGWNNRPRGRSPPPRSQAGPPRSKGTKPGNSQFWLPVSLPPGKGIGRTTNTPRTTSASPPRFFSPKYPLPLTFYLWNFLLWMQTGCYEFSMFLPISHYLILSFYLLTGMYGLRHIKQLIIPQNYWEIRPLSLHFHGKQHYYQMELLILCELAYFEYSPKWQWKKTLYLLRLPG